MSFRDIFKITRGTKVILAITFSVSMAALVFAIFYYRSENRSEDPRIAKARDHLQTWERINSIYGYQNSIFYLDSAFAIFRSLPDYQNSFETGVVYNNKCSSLLFPALYDSTISSEIRSKLLSLSVKFCDSSAMVYKRWLSEWGSLGDDAIKEKVMEQMRSDDPVFNGLNYERIIKRRIKNIKLAQVETHRRLSVSLTNKGTAFRHMMTPDSAMIYYMKALDLWPGNITAKSNLSVLKGGQPVEPSFIEKLFPPDRRKK